MPDSHVELGGKRVVNLCTDDSRLRRTGGVYRCRSMAMTDQEPPLSHQGITSRLTGLSGERPHTALSDVGDPRQSATLYSSALRLGVRYDVVRLLVGIVTLWDQPPLIPGILPGSPPIWPRPRGEFRPGDAVQLPAASGPGPIPPPAGPPPHRTPCTGVGSPRRRGSARADPAPWSAPARTGSVSPGWNPAAGRRGVGTSSSRPPSGRRSGRTDRRPGRGRCARPCP